MRMDRRSASGSSSAERLGDVEAVEKAVADEVEVARSPPRRRRPRVNAGSARTCAGSSSDARSSRARGRSAIARSAARARPSAPADTGEAPRMRPSSSDGGRPVHSPTCARKSPVGITALAVKRMCCAIIAAWWSRQRVRYATSSVVGEGVRIDRLQLAVLRDGGSACGPRPTRAAARARASPRKTSSARWKRCGISASGAGTRLDVADAVDVLHLRPSMSIP